MAKYTPRIDHSKKDYENESTDMAQDKKVVKKAFKMHDDQKHEAPMTDLAKLKKGGRAKSKKPSVREYKAGGLMKAKEITKKPKSGMPMMAGMDKLKSGGMC